MKNIFNQLLISIVATLVVSLSSCAVSQYPSDSKPITHEIWDSLLQQHVTETGNVNYQGFIDNRKQFDRYIRLLEGHHPNKKNWSKNEQLAYWINAYNAFTVKTIIDHYPVKSIKDVKNGVPFVNTVWDIKSINIEGANYDLNNLEHGIIRPQFKEPRIHFAVNCAAKSCPRLRNEAYQADRLEEQLSEQARYFLNKSGKNKITKEKAELSKILSWYRTDFKKGGGVRNFVNQYSDVKIDDNTEIEYLDYIWDLNE